MALQDLTLSNAKNKSRKLEILIRAPNPQTSFPKLVSRLEATTKRKKYLGLLKRSKSIKYYWLLATDEENDGDADQNWYKLTILTISFENNLKLVEGFKQA